MPADAFLDCAFIGLGANIGDPVEQIVSATRMIFALPQIKSAKRSSLYLSSPVGYEQQNDFVNCVVRVGLTNEHAHSKTAMHSLFESLQAIEFELGRARDKSLKDGPRTIDCDLLFYADQTSSSDHLQIPHPRIDQRLFVLLPLQELGAQLELSNGLTIEQQLMQGEFQGQEIIRLGQPLAELIA